MIKAVFFDLDDTLTDRTASLRPSLSARPPTARNRTLESFSTLWRRSGAFFDGNGQLQGFVSERRPTVTPGLYVTHQKLFPPLPRVRQLRSMKPSIQE
jgi:hypothetical protein